MQRKQNHQKQRHQKQHECGFTLLELMVAIAIFAVLGVMSATLLNNMIRQHDIISERGDQLMGLQRAMTIMQRDVSQIVSREVRTQYGDERLASVTTDGEYPLEFSRTGWSNPLEHQRSELQRVAYEHRDKTLYRYYWSVLDRAIDTEPVEQIMMEDVLSVEFEPLDGYSDPYLPGSADANPDDPRLQLAALSVRFEFEGYGEVDRIWEVPSSLDKDPQGPGVGLGTDGAGTDAEPGVPGDSAANPTVDSQIGAPDGAPTPPSASPRGANQ